MPRKLTGIKKLGPNHYEIRLARIDPRTGLRKETMRRVRGSQDVALAAKMDLLAELERGPRVREKLHPYASKWLDIRLPSLKPSTAKKYATSLDLHILPVLGAYYVDALTPHDVAQYVNARVRSGAAGNTVLNELRVIRTIARHSVAEGLADRHWADTVKAPAVNEFDEDDPNSLTADQLGAFLAVVPSEWIAVVLLIATTGLRWGEASGLKWEDIDEQAGSIRIRRTNWKGLPVTPKTKRSKRRVALLPEVLDALREHRGRLLREQNPGLAAGWVFPTAAGKLHKGSPLLKVIRQALKKAGIKIDLTCHGLRRTFNNLARTETSQLVLKAMTGHTTDRMVEHYSVVSLDEKRAASARVLARTKAQVGKNVGNEPVTV